MVLKAVTAEKIDTVAPRSLPITASDIIQNSNTPQNDVYSVGDFALYKAIRFDEALAGNVNISVVGSSSGGYDELHVKIKVSGQFKEELVIYATFGEQTLTWSETVYIAVNDTIEVWAYMTSLDNGAGYIKNLTVCYGADGMDVARLSTNTVG